MRVIILLLIVGAFVGVPVYVFNTYVTPQLSGLKDTYNNLDSMSAKVIDAVPLHK